MRVEKTTSYQRYGNFVINKAQVLGSGNFGHVYRGYYLSAPGKLQPVAVKQSYNQSQNLKQIQALQILNHPNIIQYRDYRISGSNVFMVMQLCEGGTLDDLLYRNQKHDTYKIISYFQQIVSGIKFMYEKKILHRDIKPSNILVTKRNVIKIADFGTSKLNRSSQLKLKTLVGTPLFFSPELFQMSFGEEDTYTQKSQIWALGLILYFMFNYKYEIAKAADRMKQSLPWKGKSTIQIFKSIKSEPLTFKNPERIPEQVKQIITRMLTIKVEDRMSFQELFAIKIFQKTDQLDISYIANQSQIADMKGEQTLNANPAHRETIDWQLLELLQQKDQQNCEQKQSQQLRLFYQLLTNELIQNGDVSYDNLLFQLEVKHFQYSQDQIQRSKIKMKYKNHIDIFRQIQEKQALTSIGVNYQKNRSQINHNNCFESQNFKNQKQLIMPSLSQKLSTLCKSFVRQNLNKILLYSSQTCALAEKKKNLIFLVYDLLTLITLQKSWQIKRKTKATINQYKKLRTQIKIQTILSRISKACEGIKLF